MHYATFIAYNAIGASIWALGVTLLGFLLGDRVPFVRDNLDLIFVGVVLLTVIPLAIGLLRQGRRSGRSRRSPDVGPNPPEQPRTQPPAPQPPAPEAGSADG